MTQTVDNQKGFTLIELMISIAIFGVVIAGVIGAFQDQLRSHNTQQAVMEMQQNARAAMYYMTRELKLAGLDPTGEIPPPGAGILTANRNEIRFTMDFTGGGCVNGVGDGIDNDDDGLVDEGCNDADENGNGLKDEPDEDEWFNGSTADANEDITYTLSNDADNDGLCDGIPTQLNNGTACNLMRGNQILAVNIDALNFRYLGRNPGVGGCSATDINCPLLAPVANPENIRSVQISLVARAGANVPAWSYKVTDNRVYQNQGRDIILPAQNDQFRRFFLTTEIRCRNLGLE
jgi:type IV pilus assembly protein PilW